MTKVIGQDTLETLARDIAALHRPMIFGGATKFDLRPWPPPATTLPETSASTTVTEPVPLQRGVCPKFCANRSLRFTMLKDRFGRPVVSEQQC